MLETGDRFDLDERRVALKREERACSLREH
jgi:hypothetical protein